jgi:PPOX class probable F420-dependent enzyme
MGVAIPDDVMERLKGTFFWHLATVGPNGGPQSTPVWADTDGGLVLINTAKGRAKERNMSQTGRVALSCVDLQNPYAFVEIQGKVVETVDGQPADDSIDDLAEKYLGQRPYPFRKPGEERILFKVEPTAVNVWER